MLVKPNLDALLPKTQNRYTLAILAAKRARQLIDGGQALAESESPNPVTLSCEEIAAGAVVSVPGIHAVTVPLRPEILAARLAAEAQSDEQQRLEIVRDGSILPDMEGAEATSAPMDLKRFESAFDAAVQAGEQDDYEEAEAAVLSAAAGRDRVDVPDAGDARTDADPTDPADGEAED